MTEQPIKTLESYAKKVKEFAEELEKCETFDQVKEFAMKCIDEQASLESKIEELMEDLKKKYTVVVVTHNMQQAARVSDDTAFFLVGEMVEFNDTKTMFSYPRDKRTEDYITGSFG